MLIEIVLFIVGFAMLIKGADFIVDSAAKIAKQIGASDFLIGLTIVAVGTSLPEFATGITAAYFNDTALVVGNVIGASIANIALIMGLSGLLAGGISIDKNIYHRDGFIMLLIVLLFYIFSLNGTVSRLEGGIFLWLFLTYILYFILMRRKLKHEFHFKKYHAEFISLKKTGAFPMGTSIRSLFESAMVLVIGLVGVIFGADFVVTSVAAFPIPRIVAGLVLVSFGTTLPELSVAISAIRKKYYNVMVGNVIGSVIADVLLVGGTAAVIRPLVIQSETISIHLPVFLFFTWIFLFFIRKDYRIKAMQGLALLLIYFAFIVYLFVKGI